MQRQKPFFQTIDLPTIAIYFALVIMGWLSVYGASYDFENPSKIFDFSQRAGKQFIWILTAIGFAGIILLIDAKIYNYFAYIFYGLVMLLLIATIFLAPNIKGSHSWLVFGPVNFQPAELAKVATALALARFMSSYNYKFRTWKDLIPLLSFILLPLILIFLQNETGTALVFLAFLLMFYREGMSGVVILLGLLAILLFVLVVRFNAPFGAGTIGITLAMTVILLIQFIYSVFFEKDARNGGIVALGAIIVMSIAFMIYYFSDLNINFSYVSIAIIVFACIFWAVQALFFAKKRYWFIVIMSLCSIIYCFSINYLLEDVLEPHQQKRIKVVLNIDKDLSDAGYNVNQSKIAIGSGGFMGKGFLNGTQTKLKFVPEQDTDFIFCTVGEEHGFVGSIVVLGLFMFMLFRLLKLAERQRDVFSRVYGYCVASILFFHFTINIGMVLGLLPVIGIPLPFFSYGGSSLWCFTILLFIFLKLDAERLN